MNKKKLLSLLVMAVIAAGLLAGCGGTKTPGAPQGPPPPPQTPPAK